MRYQRAALRLLALLGLALSAVLLVDHLTVRPAFCGFHSGCDTVIFSPYGRPLGVPLPLLGLAAFGLFLVLTLIPHRRAAALVGPAALLAGVVGLGLILVQVLLLRQTCPLCLLADAAALGMAAVILGSPPRGEAVPPSSAWGIAGWLTAGVLAVAAPPLWVWLRPTPPVPAQVQAQWVEGKITVVELTDFGCKPCRQANPLVEEFVRRQGKRVRLVRLVLPLPEHVHSREAARAYLAADTQGRGAGMADALFAAEDHSAGACRRLAETLGLDLAAYDRMVSDPATDAALDATAAWVKESGLRGLPLVWVQDQLLVGVPTPEALTAAYRRAERSAAENL
jgi:uncharacterized membrane protein